MRTLYVSDLDGTLLNPEAALTPETKEKLNVLIADGLPFTYATARSYSSASVVTAGLNLALPVITHNGAFIVSPDGKVLDRQLIPVEPLAVIAAWMEEHAWTPLVYAILEGRERVSWLEGRENEGLRNYLASRRGNNRLRAASSYEELFVGDIFHITCIGSEAEGRSMEPLLNGLDVYYHLAEDIYTPQEFWLEISSPESSKANAVQRLQRMVQAERIVCFGDNVNDLSMFAVSDAGYAVANAREELKAAATSIIGSNTEDGVARWLQAHAVYEKGGRA